MAQHCTVSALCGRTDILPAGVMESFNDIVGAKLDLVLVPSSANQFINHHLPPSGTWFCVPRGTFQTWFAGIIHFLSISRAIPSIVSIYLSIYLISLLRDVRGKIMFRSSWRKMSFWICLFSPEQVSWPYYVCFFICKSWNARVKWTGGRREEKRGLLLEPFTQDQALLCNPHICLI